MRALFITVGLVGVLGAVGFFRAQQTYREHQTCVAPDAANPVRELVDLALSGDPADLVAAGDAFAGNEGDGRLPADILQDPLPPDTCFAETLYVKAAQQGYAPALERLANLYRCGNPFAFGTASESAFKDIAGRLNDGSGASWLESRIGVLSYFPNPFACGGSANMMCQTPAHTHPAWLTKQTILCGARPTD